VSRLPVHIWSCLFILTLAGVDLQIQGEPSPFHVDVDQIVIPVIVLDGEAHVVDLDREDFKVYEDGVEQRITFFAQVDFPISVSLLLDTSASMKDQLNRIQEEAVRFVRQLRDDDEVMVVSFDDRVRIENSFTIDRKAVEEAVRGTGCGETTCLCDAVGSIARKLQGKQGRKAMVLFSDGVDWGSRIFNCEAGVSIAQEANLPIFPILFDTLQSLELHPEVIGFDRRMRRWYADGQQYLGRLAKASGGTMYTVRGLETLGIAFSQIASELRSMFTLGYVSSNSIRAGRFRRIKVEVGSIPAVQIKHKHGYYGRNRTAHHAELAR